MHLGLNVGETASFKVRIPFNAKNLCGRVERGARFCHGGQNMAVYCVESFLDAEEVDTIEDNEKFARSTNAQHETVYLQQDQHPSTLIFIYMDKIKNTLSSTTRSNGIHLEQGLPLRH